VPNLFSIPLHPIFVYLLNTVSDLMLTSVCLFASHFAVSSYLCLFCPKAYSPPPFSIFLFPSHLIEAILKSSFGSKIKDFLTMSIGPDLECDSASRLCHRLPRAASAKSCGLVAGWHRRNVFRRCGLRGTHQANGVWP
jgi:hypothetical protein